MQFPIFLIGLLFSARFCLSACFLAGWALFRANQSGARAVDRSVDIGASVQNCGRDW